MPPEVPVKITPSMLTFLWEECRRCFWLHARGLHRPRMPFPSVFTRYHDALSRYCLGRCPSELDASLSTGRFVGGELWVQSEPLAVGGRDGQVFIRGRLDQLAQFDDGTWGVLDFKTASPSEASARLYGRQLHAYAWALERAAPNGLARGPVSRLGLYCLDPLRVALHDGSGLVLAHLRPTWVEVERDDEAFEAFLGEVMDCLRRPAPPEHAPGCDCCRYAARRRMLERGLVNANGSVAS